MGIKKLLGPPLSPPYYNGEQRDYVLYFKYLNLLSRYQDNSLQSESDSSRA